MYFKGIFQGNFKEKIQLRVCIITNLNEPLQDMAPPIYLLKSSLKISLEISLKTLLKYFLKSFLKSFLNSLLKSILKEEKQFLFAARTRGLDLKKKL